MKKNKSSARMPGVEGLSNPDPNSASSIHEFNALDIDGNAVSLSKYKGFVTYIVNVASA